MVRSNSEQNSSQGIHAQTVGPKTSGSTWKRQQKQNVAVLLPTVGQVGTVACHALLDACWVQRCAAALHPRPTGLRSIPATRSQRVVAMSEGSTVP